MLDTQVTASTLADAKRVARLARLDAADDAVDTWYRHIESYLEIEARRRASPHAAAAGALHEAAFSDGLAHINDPIADENRICREALVILRSSEHAATVQAIELPAVWFDRWETALDESDAAYKDVDAARSDKQSSVNAGRDAEAEWVELSCACGDTYRAERNDLDTARIQEGKALLAPSWTCLAN
ncbi:MAG: hypothetical protein IPM54_12285 [Polyangiaceae bacterium]|nr:hypothetical protein [Polyangiaceae bacterium]